MSTRTNLSALAAAHAALPLALIEPQGAEAVEAALFGDDDTDRDG